MVLWCFSTAIFANPFLPETDSPEVPELDHQIQLIDAEILILKGELARKSGEVRQVSQYLVALKSYHAIGLSQAMLDRILALENYVKDSLVMESEDQRESVAKPFKFDTEKIVILLPLSGPYQPIGERILEGLKVHFEQFQPVVIDSYIFDSMLELWELVKLYNPTFIIGPLQKEKTQAFSDLKIDVPTLYLNDVTDLSAHQKSLSMNRLNHVRFLADLIIQNRHERVIFLTNESIPAQRFLSQFKAHWLRRKQVASEQNEIEFYEHFEYEVILGSVDQTMTQQLNVERSFGRKNWLQRKIETTLTFQERSRKDIELVVSIMPYRMTMQVTPLLEFYHLHQVTHYWLPSQLPKADELNKNLSFWHDTHAILPVSYARSVETDVSQLSSRQVENLQTGTFYAFGVLAAKVVMQLTAEDMTPIQSEIGQVLFEPELSPQLLPELYWLNEGKITPP